VGLAWLALEPIGKGPQLLGFTTHHGLDLGDLPGLALLVAGVALVLSAPESPEEGEDRGT
jgi:hypothetical protein